MKKAIMIFMMILTLSYPVFSETDQPDTWAIEGINQLKFLGHFRDQTFQDYKEDITRGDFIYIAVRLYEVLSDDEVVIDQSISFVDTKDEYALKGATIGLSNGIGDGKFGPNEILTREQLATLMVKVIDLLQIEMRDSSNELFNDDELISSWAKESIYKAKSNNIISGVGNNLVDPQGLASVQMSLVITNKILNEKNGGTAINEAGQEVVINIYQKEKPIEEAPVEVPTEEIFYLNDVLLSKVDMNSIEFNKTHNYDVDFETLKWSDRIESDFDKKYFTMGNEKFSVTELLEKEELTEKELIWWLDIAEPVGEKISFLKEQKIYKLSKDLRVGLDSYIQRLIKSYGDSYSFSIRPSDIDSDGTISLEKFIESSYKINPLDLKIKGDTVVEMKVIYRNN
jgi:hypothetical protein